MTTQLDSADKKIVLLSVLFLAALTVVALLLSPRNSRGSRGFPSSYSTDPGGGKAAYMLLSEMGYNVERWTNPPEELPKSSDGTLLVIGGPFLPASKDEQMQIRQFVAAGGRLLITGMLGAEMVGAKGVAPVPPFQVAWQTYDAEKPSPLTRNAPTISMETSARWTWLNADEERYYGTDDGAIVTKFPLGDGEVIWWGGDSPLTNYGITKASNLALFLNCLGTPKPRRILWDEYFHGARQGLWSYLARTPLPWAFLQFLILAAFAIATYARRSGVIRPMRQESRLSPLEFVQTVGGLYEHKHAGAGALEIALSHFRFQLARRLGLSPAVGTAELIQHMGEKPGWNIPGFAETLQQIEAALSHQQVTETKALEWVASMHDFAHRLGL
jgi:Domain of unknown function (DUF4350)